MSSLQAVRCDRFVTDAQAETLSDMGRLLHAPDASRSGRPLLFQAHLQSFPEFLVRDVQITLRLHDAGVTEHQLDLLGSRRQKMKRGTRVGSAQNADPPVGAVPTS